MLAAVRRIGLCLAFAVSVVLSSSCGPSGSVHAVSLSSSGPLPVSGIRALQKDGVQGHAMFTDSTGILSRSFAGVPGKVLLIYVFGQQAGDQPPTLTAITHASVAGSLHVVSPSAGDTTHTKRVWLAWGVMSSTSAGIPDFRFSSPMSDVDYIAYTGDHIDPTDPIGQFMPAQRKDGNVATSAPAFGWGLIDPNLNMSMYLLARVLTTVGSESTADTYAAGWTKLTQQHTNASSPMLEVAFKAGQDTQPAASWTTGGADYYAAFVELRAAGSLPRSGIQQADVVPLISTTLSNVTGVSLPMSSLNPPALNRFTLAAISTTGSGPTSGPATVPPPTVGAGMSMTQLGNAVRDGNRTLSLWFGAWTRGTFGAFQLVLGANSTVSIDVFQVSHVRTTGTNGSGAIGVRDIDAANRTASGAIALTTPGTSNGNLIVAVYACDVNYGGLAYPVMKPPAGFAFAATPRTPAGLVTGSPVGPTGLLVAFRNSGVPGVTFTQPGATHSLGGGVELVAG